MIRFFGNFGKQNQQEKLQPEVKQPDPLELANELQEIIDKLDEKLRKEIDGLDETLKEEIYEFLRMIKNFTAKNDSLENLTSVVKSVSPALKKFFEDEEKQYIKTTNHEELIRLQKEAGFSEEDIKNYKIITNAREDFMRMLKVFTPILENEKISSNKDIKERLREKFNSISRALGNIP